MWVSDDFEEVCPLSFAPRIRLLKIKQVVCVGSVEELEQLSGCDKLTDIHRDKIDHITIPSTKGKGVLRRVDEVFDCWFESGRCEIAPTVVRN